VRNISPPSNAIAWRVQTDIQVCTSESCHPKPGFCFTATPAATSLGVHKGHASGSPLILRLEAAAGPRSALRTCATRDPGLSHPSRPSRAGPRASVVGAPAVLGPPRDDDSDLRGVCESRRIVRPIRPG
jgi:hypothetical protein